MEFFPGAVVRLTDIKSSAALNGCQGTIQKQLESGRWQLRLDNGRLLNVPPQNLVLAQAPVNESAAEPETPVREVPAWACGAWDAESAEERSEWVPTTPPGSRDAPAGGAQGWGHELLDRLVRSESSSSESTALVRVWAPWARHADELAHEQISQAFEGEVLPWLTAAATASRPEGALGVLLASCGSDHCDHEASMSHLQRLTREQFPSACLAQVGPQDCGTAQAATKRICEQLLPSAASAQDAAEGEGEDEACAGDEELAFRGCGMRHFAVWYADQEVKPGLVVLFISQVKAVPPATLLQLLQQLGSVRGDYGVPAVVVLGVQDAPLARLSLLRSSMTVSLSLHKAVRVFDSQEICNRLLERILLDPRSLPVAPELLHAVRRECSYRRRSVTHTLQLLAVVCREHLGRCSLPFFGSTAVGFPSALAAASREELVAHFTRLFLQAQPAVLARLEELCGGPAAEGAAEEAAEGAAAGRAAAPAAAAEWAGALAADVALWRRRCCAALPVLDALLCAGEPLQRAEPRFRRLACFYTLLWPKVGAGPEAETAALQKRQASSHLARTLKKAFEPQSDEDEAAQLKRLTALHRELTEAAGALDEELRGELAQLAQGGAAAAWAEALRAWGSRVCERYCEPLAGAAGAFIRELAGGAGLLEEAVARLSGGSIADALLTKISTGRRRDHAEDVTLLWRLVQGTLGQRLPLNALWRDFAESAAPLQVVRKLPAADDAEEAEDGEPAPKRARAAGGGAAATGQAVRVHRDLRQRFAAAQAALQMCGLLQPCAGAAGPKSKETGRRLSKRLFGRCWGKTTLECLPRAEALALPGEGGEAAEAAEAEGGEAREQPPGAGERPAERPLLRPGREAPAWTSRLRSKLLANQQLGRRRILAGRTSTRLAEKKQKVRMFMG